MMKAILFDFGNTIVRQDNLDWKKLERAGLLNHIDYFKKRNIRQMTFVKWSNSFYRQMSLHQTLAEKYFIEVNINRIFQHLIIEYALPSDITPSQLTQMFYLSICQSRLLFDDVIETLKAIHEKKIMTCVISNAVIPGSLMNDVLKRLHILDYFAFTFYSSDLGFRKPHPNMFELAIARLKLKPSQIIMVGDHLNEDVKGALAAGMQAVWINRNGKPSASTANKTYKTIYSLSELLTRVK
jgi:putative hydrolase of the HAD superfamily